MSLIFRLSGKPTNLDDVAEILKKQGRDNVTIIREAGSGYRPFIDISEQDSREMKRFYLKTDYEEAAQQLAEAGITASLTTYAGRI